MKPFFNVYRTRCTSIVMAFVWMMALGIGIANACLLDPVQGHHGTIERAAAFSHVDTDEHAVSVDKAVCLDVCAAEQTAFIKVKPLDVPTGLDAATVLFLSVLIVAVVDQKNQVAPDSTLFRYELPVSIRFSRLTI